MDMSNASVVGHPSDLDITATGLDGLILNTA